MPEQSVEDLKDSVRQLMTLVIDSGQPLSQELKKLIAQALEHAAGRIQELRQQETAVQQPIPLGADLLWNLAGGQPGVFTNYLKTVPDPALNALLQNPTQLKQIIVSFSNTMPGGEQPEADGVPHADINSSNIYGFKYNPKTGKLFVRFNNGSIYGYEGVPGPIYQIFSQGAIPAKTQGKNQWGRWWVGKSPSLGASFYEMIKKGGYPYQKVK